MKVLLFQPEIPQNTGNIVRTCSVTGSELILVKPLGFSLTSKYLKRAGLDYWNDVTVREIDDLLSYLENTKKPFYFLSSKANKNYTEVSYEKDSILIFGNETSGLPEIYHKKYADRFLTIPMKNGSRCLNLSNAVSVVLYEALRQNNFIF